MKKYSILLFLSCFISGLYGQVIDSSKLVLSQKVFFDFGKYELTDIADSVITAIAAEIAPLKNSAIQITAHTDAIGSVQANFVLSENRAKIVSQRLIEKGVDQNSIQIQVFGEEKPETENNTDEGRQLNRRATIDVYQKIKLVAVSGQVKDETTGNGISAMVVIRTKQEQDSLQTDTTGNFKTLLPVNTIAGIDIYAKNYFFETQMFKATSNLKKAWTIPLKKVAVGEKATIKNLYFVGNKAVLLRRSLPELPKLLKFMQLNNTITIEIAGHINRPNYPPVDKLSWDFKLSVERAKMVYDYLIQNNIMADRLSYKGYGNFQMHYPKAKNEKEQAENRRVEIRIVEKEE